MASDSAEAENPGRTVEGCGGTGERVSSPSDERYREEEALPHFQRAVDLDPGFAMALAKLGVVHDDLGRQEEADEFAVAALQHIERLSARD